jgi:cellulose synthase/poly-beta-1,6-N-acetylglucosamine synthase-like glycosyltransferase
MLNLHRHYKIGKTLKGVDQIKKVTVVVPCFNEEKVIRASIESLIGQSYGNLEIVVVDDGSSDNTYLIAKNLEFDDGKKSLKAFRIKNSGKANALNYGIKAAKGELFLAVDADSKLSYDAIALMVRYFDDPKVGAVAGSVYVTNLNNIWTKLQALEYIQGLNLVRNGQALFQLVNIIPGPIGMFRKDIVMELGGYEGDTYAEDCDLTLNLISHRYKVDYEIDAISYTEAPEELLDLIKQRYRWTRGILQALKKHKRYFIDIFSNYKMSIVLWYMLFEAIFWPIGSILINFFIIYLGFSSGFDAILFYWWILFTLLDVTASIYCVSITKEKMILVLYALYYRIFFINVINVAKVLATLEEVLNIKMNWGKLERKGRI